MIKAYGISSKSQAHMVYEAMGKYEEAVKCYLRSVELSEEPKDLNADIAGGYALLGKREEAQKILNNILENSK